MTSWYDRVSEKIKALRDREQDDRILAQQIAGDIDDMKSRKDGETINLTDNEVTKLFHGELVFRVTVRDGLITVKPAVGDNKAFKDKETAIELMADLMAAADWAKRREDELHARRGQEPIARRTASRAPLYPT